MQTATATGYPAVDRDVERATADIARGFPTGEIVLAEDRLDLAEMGILTFVAEPDFFAVREEDERHIE